MAIPYLIHVFLLHLSNFLQSSLDICQIFFTICVHSVPDRLSNLCPLHVHSGSGGIPCPAHVHLCLITFSCFTSADGVGCVGILHLRPRRRSRRFQTGGRRFGRHGPEDQRRPLLVGLRSPDHLQLSHRSPLLPGLLRSLEGEHIKTTNVVHLEGTSVFFESLMGGGKFFSKNIPDTGWNVSKASSCGIDAHGEEEETAPPGK